MEAVQITPSRQGGVGRTLMMYGWSSCFMMLTSRCKFSCTYASLILRRSINLSATCERGPKNVAVGGWPGGGGGGECRASVLSWRKGSKSWVDQTGSFSMRAAVVADLLACWQVGCRVYRAVAPFANL